MKSYFTVVDGIFINEASRLTGWWTAHSVLSEGWRLLQTHKSVTDDVNIWLYHFQMMNTLNLARTRGFWRPVIAAKTSAALHGAFNITCHRRKTENCNGHRTSGNQVRNVHLPCLTHQVILSKFCELICLLAQQKIVRNWHIVFVDPGPLHWTHMDSVQRQTFSSLVHLSR